MRCDDCGAYCACGPKDLCLCEPVCPKCRSVADTLPAPNKGEEEGDDGRDEQTEKPSQ
jgi:hypothetical protein